jgi:outer membrane protein, heavy metal efflux system
MFEYGKTWRCGSVLALAIWLAGCVAPSSKESLQKTAALVATQTPLSLQWRRDPGADQAARTGVEQMLADGLTVQEAVAVAMLVSPEIQLALEQVEITRSEFVAAVTPMNPAVVLGSRRAGGNLAAFYPERSLSVGILQNVISLLNLPDRKAIARHDLAVAQLQAAQGISEHAALVAQYWLEHKAALQIRDLRQRSVAAAQAALDTIIVSAANGSINALNVAVERNTLIATKGAAIRADLDVATSRERLGKYLGLTGWRDDWKLAGALPVMPPNDPDVVALERDSLSQRLDLQAARTTIAARLRVLATQRRFRWLNQLELGLFREKLIGGSTFTGPNAVIELPLFDQRQSKLLNADAELRAAKRKLEIAEFAARNALRVNAAEMAATRASLLLHEREVIPNQRQIVAGLGQAADPGEPTRLRLRLSTLAAEEEQVGLLREYWRARSALALSAGQWSAHSGL